MKHSGTKTPMESLLNSVYLLAKDPDNLAYAEKFLKACVTLGNKRTGEWIAQLMFDANNANPKPSLTTYLLLKDSFNELGLYSQAVKACQMASQLKPDDRALLDELRDLTAKMTMDQGKYGKAVTFRDSIRDKDYQDQLQSQENVIKSDNVKQRNLGQARTQHKEAPTSTTNILQLAEALVDAGQDTNIKEAAELLHNAYERTKDFIFKRKSLELELKLIREKIRHLHDIPDYKTPDSQTAKMAAALTAQLDQKELSYYQQCVENYPTDLQFKFDYGRCLIKSQQFDKAIPLFQESRRDPRLRILSLDKIGLCFLLKEWFDDAIDIFNEALKEYPSQESPLAKDIRYNLARAYEASNKTDNALDIYRKLAQIDFSYKDVSQRIDKLRSHGNNS